VQITVGELAHGGAAVARIDGRVVFVEGALRDPASANKPSTMPIGDAYRKSYRKLLRWNDEYPFVKFSLAEDDRPVLASEIPLRSANRDELGLAIARSLAIADQLLEESAGWLWIGGRIPDSSDRVSRGAHLFDRYREGLGELVGDPADPAGEPANERQREPASEAPAASGGREAKPEVGVP